MNILLTNDDGIEAPGIRSLFNCVSGNKVFVAPHEAKSGCGHQVSTGRDFQIEKRTETEFAIHGTPADCVRLFPFLLKDKIDWVLSGINAGGNLGVDLYISGTAAAAREAAILGYNAIAISQRIRDKNPINWEMSERYTKQVLSELMNKPLAEKTFWNVNLPHIFSGEKEPKIVYCTASKLPLDMNYVIKGSRALYRGDYAKRPRETGSDVDVCFSGNIAVSLIEI
ncbi:MAG: 5'/3'-nucleotidase SurE [Leptospiraceae bacterium]|nr:5'/3'-nucleotidase SurE [Leptospiraceae bacterium]